MSALRSEFDEGGREAMKASSLIYAVGKVPLLGKFLRWYAGQFKEGSVVTIKRGLLAGMKWKRHHRYVNGYWLGIIEPIVQDAFKQYVKPGDCVWDIGANAGFFTLLASKLSGEGGHVVAFDPQPSNLESVREQVEINGLADRVTIRGEAISDAPGTASFAFGGAGDPAGRLSGTDDRRPESIEVTCTTMDAMLNEVRPPNVIKMDIEGAELLAFQGASETLLKYKPLVILEVHSPEIGDALRPLVEAHYEWIDIEERALDAQGKPAPWHVILQPREK